MIKINQNILAKALRAGLYAVIFFLPLAVTPWTIYPFVFGKTLFFQSAIELLAALYIVLMVIAPEYRPRFDAFTNIILSYFAVMIVASVLGVDFLRSFWGTEERGAGLFTQLHFLAFFLMLRSLTREEIYRDRAFAAAVVSGLFLSAVALLRLKGILLFGVDLGFRLSGTLANPLFFAAVLVFYLFFSLYLALRQKRTAFRILYYLGALIFFVMITMAQSRGALIASLLGISFFLIVSAVKVPGKGIKIAVLIFFLSLAAFAGVVWTHSDSALWKKVPVVQRILTLKDATVSTRLLAWKVALKAFRERPVLGWGNDNFAIAFNKYYDPVLLEYSYGETWWDRPHNIMLEMLVHFGAIGAAAYLAMLFYAGYWLLRQGASSARILAAGLLAYFAQNLFVFDTPSSLMLLMVFLAGINQSEVSSIKYQVSSIDSNQKANKYPIPYTLYPIPFLALLMVYKLNWQPFIASAKMLGATLYAADTSDVGSIAFFRFALKMPTPYKEETIVQVAQITNAILSKKSIPQERFYEFFSFAESAIKANIARHPRHAYYHFMLGRLYTEALNYDKSYGQKGEEAFRRALELSPQRQQIQFGLAKLYVELGRKDEAAEIYKQAVQMAPRIGEAHWFYAVMLQDKRETEAAKKEMIEAANLGYTPSSLEEILFFARLMAAEKNYSRVIDYLESALQREPKRADLWAQLAAACKEYARSMHKDGENSVRDKYLGRARDYAKRAAELDPSFAAEYKIFIEILDKEFKK